jgi:CheY-like chemotaxis protein
MFNFAKEPHLPTLLIIDDDMVSREVMATLLTMSGYSVHTADDGPATRF